MKSFETSLIERMPISHNLASTLRVLGQYRGRAELFARQTPQVLKALRQTAIIQSTESSNRIEGVVAPIKRIEALVAKKTTPKNRPEQEIAGYRDVLNTIHANHAGMSFTPSLVLQLHRDLYQYAGHIGGAWKSSDNEITEKNPDGTTFVRFRPVPAHLTAENMEHLHSGFQRYWSEEKIDKLFLIPAYILDFLCIHPFLDGNGRMSRLLTLLLLYHADYFVGQFVSLEKLIEDSKETYYEALFRSSQGWHEAKHDLLPWLEYLLGILIAAYKEFEGRAGLLMTARGAKTQRVMEVVSDLPPSFRITDVERLCPGVSRDTIRMFLSKLREEGKLQCEKRGVGAIWRKM